MKDYQPAFILSFGLNLFVVVFLSLAMLRGYLVSFKIKNNLMIFLLIPITLMIPFSAQYELSETTKYYTFVGLLCLVGIFNAFSQGSIYGQASCFPTGDMMAALSIGKGISGMMMNFIEIIILLAHSG
jgi:hypothetical protein